MKRIEEIAPKLIVTDYTKIKRSLLEMREDHTTSVEIVYALESFDIPEEIKEYMENPWERVLYLVGRSGTGKTEMSKALCSKYFGEQGYIRINSLQGLRKLKGKDYKMIIMDDINFGELSAEEVLGLFDVKNTHEQRVLYGTVEIKPGIARMVITNKGRWVIDSN